MTQQASSNDLRTIEAVDKKLDQIRQSLLTVADLDGVKFALQVVDQLADLVGDIAASVEMELHERDAQRGR
jgi:hypothetical protein